MMKTCPDCAEEIQARANVCRHCGYRFGVAPLELRLFVLLVTVVLIAIAVYLGVKDGLGG